MVTRVGRCKIRMTLRPWKPIVWCKNLTYTSHIANFRPNLPIFCYHVNQGRRFSHCEIWMTLFDSATRKPRLMQESKTYFLYKPSYSTFYLKIPTFSLPRQPTGKICPPRKTKEQNNKLTALFLLFLFNQNTKTKVNNAQQQTVYIYHLLIRV